MDAHKLTRSLWLRLIEKFSLVLLVPTALGLAGLVGKHFIDKIDQSVVASHEAGDKLDKQAEQMTRLSDQVSELRGVVNQGMVARMSDLERRVQAQEAANEKLRDRLDTHIANGDRGSR